ncbi:alpha/beta hydrolase [Kitasatospora camelliae]|uniref:Alpha/beta fold hydrolase n=1 Tax=Kitasatospora camelliae TaxID=3156397 RepID=A0AAU8K572_9ACTN
MERVFVHHADGEALGCTAVAPAAGVPVRAERVVLMHGAGNGNRARNVPLAREFAAGGHHTLAFDFSGHGDSTGELAELSLERRYRQARSVIEEFAPAGPLVLVGFSMSGQTVADLLHHLGPRVAAIVLAAPAAYAREAWPVRFGHGFTGILRDPDSWRTSPVFPVLAGYTGPAVLLLPERDEVIPPEVTEAVEAALGTRADLITVTLPGSPHILGLWLSERPADRARVVRLVAERLDRAPGHRLDRPDPVGA